MVNPRRKSRGFGTGGVTDVQVAFLVECYLKDSSYTKTLDEFRVEASAMLSPYKSEAPMSMMSLSAILNDYIALKEQALAVQRQKARLDHMFGCLRDMVTSYQSASLAAPESPALITGPLSAVPASGLQRDNAPKRKSPTPTSTTSGQQENSMVDVTSNAMRAKRVRHVPPGSEQPVLQGLNPNTSPDMHLLKQPITPSNLKSCTSVALGHFGPFSPPVNGPLDPQTPQNSKLPAGCSPQIPQTSSKTPNPVCSTADLRDASKARSKRQSLNPTKAQSSKCKSLDFTSANEPVIVQATASPSEQPPSAASSPPLSAGIEAILSEEFASPGQLSSLDDILGTSLDGTSFSELMNSMMMDDISDEASSPCHSAGLSPATASDRDIPDVLSLEDDHQTTFQEATCNSANKTKKAPGKENTPPPSFLI